VLVEPNFRFHHLGLACRSVEAELRNWLALGYQVEGERFEDARQKIRGLFIVGCGPRLELLEPAGADSPLDGFIARGVKLYHQAFEAAVFEPALESLTERGGKLLAEPAPAVAFQGRRIAFVMLPGLNLIEIIEAESECESPSAGERRRDLA
jgi:methylmalonyl-CoA/ethylmalonyl-CoA epimerase